MAFQNLIDAMSKDELIFMDKDTSGGAFGEPVKYREGGAFIGALAHSTTEQSRIAEKEVNIANWQLTVSPELNLVKGDVFKVKNSPSNPQINGNYYQIDKGTADIKTPSISSFQFRTAYAKEFSISAEELV